MTPFFFASPPGLLPVSPQLQVQGPVKEELPAKNEAISSKSLPAPSSLWAERAWTSLGRRELQTGGKTQSALGMSALRLHRPGPQEAASIKISHFRAWPPRGVSGASRNGSEGPLRPHPPLPPPETGQGRGMPAVLCFPAPAPSPTLPPPPQGGLLYSPSHPFPSQGLYFPAGARVSLWNLAARLSGGPTAGPAPGAGQAPHGRLWKERMDGTCVPRGPTSLSHPPAKP